jgi:hypothetical protein
VVALGYVRKPNFLTVQSNLLNPGVYTEIKQGKKPSE